MKITFGIFLIALTLFTSRTPSYGSDDFDLTEIPSERGASCRADGTGCTTLDDWPPEARPLAPNVSVSDDDLTETQMEAYDESCEALGDCALPCWVVRVGAVFFDRDEGHDIQLMEEPSDRVPASTSDLNTGVQDGFYFSLIGCGCLEFTYFGIDGWNAEHTYGPLLDGARVLVADPNPFNIAGAIGPNSVTYSSKLHSSEFNLRLGSSPAIAWLAGFRYLELDERLELVHRFDGGSQNSFTTTTQNRLYGFQIGADAILLDRTPFRLEGLIKAGVYGNHARQNTLDVVDGVVFDKLVSGEDDDVAFAGELGLTCAYDLTHSISLRAGYQLLWIEGVALAPNQVPVVNFASGEGLDLRGSPFYHGALLSLELRH